MVDRLLPVSSALYSVQGLFEYNNNLDVWQFKGVRGKDGELDEEESVIARKMLLHQISSLLKELNNIGPPKAKLPDLDEERAESLQERMQQYNEEFQMMSTVTIEEFDVRMSINWVNGSYKGEVEADDGLRDKVFAKQGAVPSGQKKLILLECGKDKNKVIPIAIEQAKKFSFWIATI